MIEKSTSGESQAQDPTGPLLEHAVRVWQAEEENARRLGRRVNLHLTIVAAVFGIGLLRLLDASLDPTWLAIVGGSSLLVGLVLLSLGALHLLKFFVTGQATVEGTAQEPLIASELMMLDGSDVRTLPGEDAVSVRLELFVKTLRAGDHLGTLNYRERDRINRAQQWLLLGFFWILEALVGSTLGSAERPWLAVGAMSIVLLLALIARTRTA